MIPFGGFMSAQLTMPMNGNGFGLEKGAFGQFADGPQGLFALWMRQFSDGIGQVGDSGPEAGLLVGQPSVEMDENTWETLFPAGMEGTATMAPADINKDGGRFTPATHGPGAGGRMGWGDQPIVNMAAMQSQNSGQASLNTNPPVGHTENQVSVQTSKETAVDLPKATPDQPAQTLAAQVKSMTPADKQPAAANLEMPREALDAGRNQQAVTEQTKSLRGDIRADQNGQPIQKEAVGEETLPGDTSRSRDGERSRRMMRLEQAEFMGKETGKAVVQEPVKSIDNASQRVVIPTSEAARTTIHAKVESPAVLTPAGTPEIASRGFQTAVMEQIVEKASFRSLQGRSEMQIRLKPDFLGQVHMNIATDKDQLVVRLVTDQPMVKEMIETNLHQLKAELQNQGLTIDRFDVLVNSDSDQQQNRESFSQMFKNNTSQQGRRQEQGEQPKPGHDQPGQESMDDEQQEKEGLSYFA